MIGIYKITNKVNGKIYIGQSIDILKRWYDHKYKSFYENDVSYNSPIHSAIRKYGVQNFIFEIIEECNENVLDELEIKYIQQYNSLVPNGYNVSTGGQKRRSYAKRCIDCGTLIYKESERCNICAHKNQRKVLDRPEPLILAKMIVEKGFHNTGIYYGVSDNAIKKWCKAYNIPHMKKELKEWYYQQYPQAKNLSNKNLPKK